MSDDEKGTPGVAVRTRGLTRRFGSLTAVDRLDLEIRRGEIFGLVGPDGAGKTTTLRLLCGLMDPTEGDAEVLGLHASRRAGQLRDRIGYMPQRFGLYVDLTVDENLNFYADLFGLEFQRRNDLMNRLLRMTRMEAFRNRAAGKLSGGMKQKLGLMCALLHEPEILFLDEPTNGVDPISRREFWVILYELAQSGITVVVSTAYLDEAERCNRVGLIHQGRLILCETPNSLGRHIEQKCYRLNCTDQRKARTILSGGDLTSSLRPAGRNLRLFLRSGVTPDSVRSVLTEAGIEVNTLEEVSPTVEDVFVALVAPAGKESA
jgi:ABC-2 type transport system ATP-binding protein